MPFNLREAKQEMLIAAEAGNAIELISGSGIGKSMLCRQVFEHLRDRDVKKGIRWGYGCVFAATQTPAGIDGLQFKGERLFGNTKFTISDPSIPVWFMSDEGLPASMYDRFFLFIDEFGQAEGDVKKGFAEIFLSGRSASHALPPGSVRVAASNTGTRYGVTKDFDFSITRRKKLELIGNVDIWLEDFADHPYEFQGRIWQTLPVTKAFCKRHPEILFEKEPEKQGPWCNPRSMCGVDRELQVRMHYAGKLETDATVIESMAGSIGMPATKAFVQEIQFLTELTPYADIVADPEKAAVPKKADLMMLMAYELAHQTQPDDLPQCIKYVDRLPKDMALTYVGALHRRDYKSFYNHPAMIAWAGKNASLVAILSSMTRQA